MNRFVFGRGWVYQDETKGDGGDAGGGAAADDGAAAGEGAAAGDGADDGAATAADGTKKVAEPKDMKSAIDAALGYTKKLADGGDAAVITPEKGGEKKGAKPSAADAKETETHHANGAPKKNEKGEALDDKGQVIKAAPKVKTAAELDLKPEEKKQLHTKTQARFAEVITTLKAHEGTIATLQATNETLGEARDAILGVLEETHTTQEQLGAYLEFNRLVQSSDPKDLEEALKMIEGQRAALYKALGREPQGGDLDLLADFQDLQKQVDDSEITRAAALEIAKGRRERAARDADTQRQQQQQRQQTQTAEQRKQAAETALGEIEKWTGDLAKTDLDYKAKEAKLLGETLDGVLKEYPPKFWLPTLKRLYASIVVEKAPAPSGKQNQPLRTSGARPGAKAPTSMLDAINQGLGYAGAEKG